MLPFVIVPVRVRYIPLHNTLEPYDDDVQALNKRLEQGYTVVAVNHHDNVFFYHLVRGR